MSAPHSQLLPLSIAFCPSLTFSVPLCQLLYVPLSASLCPSVTCFLSLSYVCPSLSIVSCPSVNCCPSLCHEISIPLWCLPLTLNCYLYQLLSVPLSRFLSLSVNCCMSLSQLHSVPLSRVFYPSLMSVPHSQLLPVPLSTVVSCLSRVLSLSVNCCMSLSVSLYLNCCLSLCHMFPIPLLCLSLHSQPSPVPLSTVICPSVALCLSFCLPLVPASRLSFMIISWLSPLGIPLYLPLSPFPLLINLDKV